MTAKKKTAESPQDTRIIHHNSEHIDEHPDTTTYPFHLEANLSAPSFMTVAFVGLYGGSEEIVVEARTREALEEFVARNELGTHPRLRRMTIVGPNVRASFNTNTRQFESVPL